MLAGMILGAALVIAALMLFGAGKFALRGERQFVGISVVGLLVAVAVAVIAIRAEWDGPDEGAESSAVSSSGISFADLARASAVLDPSRARPAPESRVASVPSLIEGLERRLESEPSDASGWALLAQSRAFVGDIELAEEALLRAVDLGLDEADLRQRVEGARRGPHGGLSAPSTR